MCTREHLDFVIGERYAAAGYGMTPVVPPELIESWAKQPLGEWTVQIGEGRETSSRGDGNGL